MKEMLSLLVIFAEPGFPTIDVATPVPLDGAVVARTVAELREALTPGRVLVWRHGSAFPAEAWEPLIEFLETGGSMLYLGGEPFTRTVVGQPGAREVQPRNLAMLKALRLNQCYRVEAGGGAMRPIGPGADWPGRQLAASAWTAILEPRLCDTRDFPAEEGSPGTRDAVVQPWGHVFMPRDEPFATAAAAVIIDRLRGRWAGGRWVFWLVSEPPTETELASLIREAVQRPAELRVDPTFGCFHPGERPSVLINVYRPGVTEPATFDVALTATLPDGTRGPCGRVQLTAAEHGHTRVMLEIEPAQGLYRVSASAEGLPDVETGFWVFDPRLFTSGDELSLDGYTLRRAGQPEPVVGTTLMSGATHRKFLFEPNAAHWDDTFRELAALKVNLVRTGVWSGWRKVVAEPGATEEAWLRALEGFYLTARKHGIPVLFSFFAFLPDAFGGENPYLDPRAVEAQRAFVSTVASRFAGAKEILWDLINEPSFSSPQHAWKCRPNGDLSEEKTFLRWLRKRYAAPDAPETDEAWQSLVRARWRLSPDEKIGLPELEDFEDRHTFEKRHPYRAAEYVHFAQDAFADWATQLSASIRQAGSPAPITVGQDEGGLFQRPSPLFHHPAVDFTSMHTWWLNDSLLLDGLAARAGGKPLLISETGVMQREGLSGEALRSGDDAARLLSRKMAYAFAAGAFGVVQWCYNVNPYMASDNEVAIGLRRVDGSYKPEHRVFRGFADFVARNRARFAPPPDADVVLLASSSELFSPRDHASAALRRAVEVLTRELGVFPRIVPEHRAPKDLGRPRIVILPACRGISDAAWTSLAEWRETGGVLICSGWFEIDDAGHAVKRLGLDRRPLGHVELALLEDSGKAPGIELRFPLGVTESAFAATGDERPGWVAGAEGRIWHHPLPLEWAEDTRALRHFYATGLTHAALGPFTGARDAPPGMMVRRIPLADAELLIAVNESAQPRRVATGEGSRPLDVRAFTGRMAIVSNRTGGILDATATE